MEIVVEESFIAIMLSPDNAGKQTKKRQITLFKKKQTFFLIYANTGNYLFRNPLYIIVVYMVQSDRSFGYYKSGTKLIILGRIQNLSPSFPLSQVRGGCKASVYNSAFAPKNMFFSIAFLIIFILNPKLS